MYESDVVVAGAFDDSKSADAVAGVAAGDAGVVAAVAAGARARTRLNYPSLSS